MKRLLFFVAGCLMIACNMTEDVENQVVSKKLFHTTIDDESTRTFVDEKIRLRWTEGDLISLFEGTTRNKKYKFLGETGDNAGDFEDITTGFGSGNDIDRYYAIYPYSSTTKLHEDGYITYTFPAEQNYAENSFGLGANPMVAVTGGLDDFDLCFRNAAGYLRLYLYGDDVAVKSIKIEGNNSEPLAGKAYITPEFGGFPTTEMDETATTSVTLTCGEGVKIGSTAEASTPFWVVLPPTVFTEGFTLLITNSNDEVFTKSFSSKISIERNKYISARVEFVLTTPEPEPEPEPTPNTIPNNQIWYTCWDNKMVYPNTEKALDYFGANIIDHQFADNKGVITFDGDVKRISNIDAISGQNSLSTITLPESVEYVGERVLVGANLSEFHGKFASEDHLLLISNDTIVARTAYGFSSEYTIPDGVVHIGYGVFQRVPCEVVNMPNSVKSIGESAFSNCKMLTTVNLSNCLESIGLSAFYWCGKLKNIVLPESFNKFDTYSIYGAGNVNGTFSGTSLTEIIIPAGVTTIPSHTFEYCSNLKSVILHDGIKEIKDMAFRNCPNLEMINFPNTLESIGYSSFGVSQITSLSLPASIKMIGCLNFQNCSQLTIVECRAITPPDVTLSAGNSKWNTFLNHSTDSFRIKVPSISVDAYKAADGWNEYAEYIEAGEF